MLKLQIKYILLTSKELKLVHPGVLNYELALGYNFVMQPEAG